MQRTRRTILDLREHKGCKKIMRIVNELFLIAAVCLIAALFSTEARAEKKIGIFRWTSEGHYSEVLSQIMEQLKKAARTVYVIPGLQTALDLGNAKTLNIVVMGALSGLLESPASLWEEVIRKRVPQKLIALNLDAFRKGKGLIK